MTKSIRVKNPHSNIILKNIKIVQIYAIFFFFFGSHFYSCSSKSLTCINVVILIFVWTIHGIDRRDTGLSTILNAISSPLSKHHYYACLRRNSWNTKGTLHCRKYCNNQRKNMYALLSSRVRTCSSDERVQWINYNGRVHLHEPIRSSSTRIFFFFLFCCWTLF